MKVVIIGASGFVGSYLAYELESAGHSVIKTDLPDSGAVVKLVQPLNIP